MKVFEAKPAGGFEWVKPVDPGDFHALAHLGEHVLVATWTPVRVRRIPPSKERDAAPSDFPWLGDHVLVMRERAAAALGDVLRGSGELLPLACEDGTRLYAFNSRIVVNGLDEERSSIVRFGNGRIMRVRRPFFVRETIRGLDVFRAPDAAGSTYVSERFTSAVNLAQLVGLRFEQVWEGATDGA